MDNETKRMLLKHVDSYWDMLPPELKEVILKFKQSQELIEWRESIVSRELRREIQAYGLLRQYWFIGPIQCKVRIPKGCECRPRCFWMKIFGHYWDLNGERKKVFLGYSFCTVTPRCHVVKNGLGYRTNPDHTLSVSSMSFF